MPNQILLNIGIALVWILLQGNFTIQSFVVGYALGMLFLYIFRKQLDSKFYFFRLWAVFKLFLFFVKELIVANFVVIAQVLRPKLNVKPGIIIYETELETPMQITILTSMITLIPGSVSMEVSTDNKSIYIHVFHIDDKEEIIRHIREDLEGRIKEVVS